MNNFLALLLSLLLLYKYWALFIVIFLAAVIVPFPSNSILLATGAFASQGYFSFTVSLVVAVSANVLGDCVDYMLAARYGRPALRLLHIHVPTYIERLEEFVRSYPRSTIFITRFVGTVEEVVSFLAGFTRVSFHIFLIYDLLGNLVSIGGVLYVGYFTGIHWQDVSTLVGLTNWICVGCVGVVCMAVFLWRQNSTREKSDHNH